MSDAMTRIRRLVEQNPDKFNDERILLDAMDRRVAALLEANNGLVLERNIIKQQADYYQASVDFLLQHNGTEQIQRLETENRALKHERDEARHQERVAWAQAQIFMDDATKSKINTPIVEKAIQWGKSILSLRQAQKPEKDGKTKTIGVLEANQNYTKAHLSLLQEITEIINRGS